MRRGGVAAVLRNFESDSFTRISSSRFASLPITPLDTPHNSTTMANDNAFSPKTAWSSFLSEIYLTDRRPVNGSYDYRAIEEKAREVTKDNRGAYSLLSISCIFPIEREDRGLHVHIWQRRDEQHVSEQPGGTRAMAHHSSYAA